VSMTDIQRTLLLEQGKVVLALLLATWVFSWLPGLSFNESTGSRGLPQ